MAASETFPPLDFTQSPYTGWIRTHWESLFTRLTYGYVLAAERSGSPARALYPEDLRNQPDSVDALESFARIAPAWAAWLSNPSNPSTVSYGGHTIDLANLLCQALVEGTDPDHPDMYWGEMDHLSQHIVEAADVAVTIWLSREKVFNRLTPREQSQIIAWLAQVDGKETYFDNWILFPAMAMTVRAKLGYPAPMDDLDARLEQVAKFYRGDGWYADGAGNEFELYNAWMFGWHYLLWAWIDGDRRPDHRELVFRRARSFLAGFPYFFGANGSYPAWGRSIVYRFSAVSTFALGHLLSIASASPGLLRRIASGNMRYFYEHGFLDPEDHHILQGYHGRNPQAGESYISPGSPYWACHAFFPLSFDRQDPFWAAVEDPLPVEKGDYDLALPAPGFALHGDLATGQVLLLNGKSGPADEVLPDAGSHKLASQSEISTRYGPRHDYPSKYGKFAYSTHFPFNVAPIPTSYSPDSMLGLSVDGITFGHRGVTLESGVAPGIVWSRFQESVAGELQDVCVANLMWKDLQIRLAWIQPSLAVRAFEAPGALGCDFPARIRRQSNPEQGWEYAEVDGRALGIYRLMGFDDQSSSAPFRGYSTINLAYAYSEFPLVFEAQANAKPRHLGAVSLVRPAPFNPAQEFSGIMAEPVSPGIFQVTLPDSQKVYVDLSAKPVQSIQFAGHSIEGNAIRIIRMNPDASSFTALGVKAIKGLIDMEQAGTISIRRDKPEEIQLTTDSGFALSPAWLGNPIRKVEVQNLSDAWIDLTSDCPDGSVSQGIVEQWSRMNERTLVNFRIQL